MKEYCCGFYFSIYDVLLILKAKPAWQVGKFNGIGGLVEAGETPKQAMIREFKEETGGEVNWWFPLVILTFDNSIIHFFHAAGAPFKAQGTLEEPVVWFDYRLLPWNVIPNLHWLIPLCREQNIQFPLTIKGIK